VAAQIFNPVKWEWKAERTSATEATVILTATCDAGWHIYSQTVPDGGPIATTFDYKELSNVKLSGKTTEPKGHTEFDKAFAITLTYFEKTVTFKQKVKVTKDPASVGGEIGFMVCNDERCLPPDYIPFKVDIPKFERKTEEPKADTTGQGMNTPLEPSGIQEPVKWEFKLGKATDGTAELQLVGTVEAGWHYYSTRMPADFPFPTLLNWTPDARYALVDSVLETGLITHYDSMFGMALSYFEGKALFAQRINILTDSAFTIKGSIEGVACNNNMCTPPDRVEFSIDIPPGSRTQVATADADTSWVGIFIGGFLGGLFALLTPCVFPMIPLTVSFFTKQSKTKAMGIRNAVLYGLSIIGIYVLLGFGVTMVFGADALNALSTNVWFNIFFFVLLVVFAISFLGAFEITLPSSWVNKADQASEQGGLIGIFFMAFTLSLVSFSCTGPIIGTLLVEAAVNGGVLGPIMGMTGFSMALALPFGLFAAFPGWLNTLPKSGGWLNSVKVVLGLLELALALKFLSNADLVVQAHLLTREVFLAIWIAIFGSLTLYLFGFIRFPHDSPTTNLSIPRFLFGLAALIFTIYMVPGLWGAPLKVISGFPPPQFYSESPKGLISASTGGGTATADHGTPKAGDGHCPHDLPCFHDYETGLAHAKKVGKPIMLDFTGWACVNCRKMEEQVWSDPEVLRRLAEDYVLISLYVDEKTELPKDQQVEVTIGDRTKTLRTIGNRWSHMQAERFGTNSQPYYVVLDHNERQIGPPAAYDPDIQKYINWLDAGLKGFKEGK
jgi:thiol:disulfide interchange protein DsbD